MSLSMIQKPKPVAPIITLVGTPGVGKTTLAALFPNPVFIQAEEITGVFDDWDDEKKPDSFPVLKRADAKRKTSTKDDLLSQLRALITSKPPPSSNSDLDSTALPSERFQKPIFVSSRFI
jgi:hypothetical protein